MELFRERLLKSPVLHIDETTVQVMNEEGQANIPKSYAWTLCMDASRQSVAVYYKRALAFCAELYRLEAKNFSEKLKKFCDFWVFNI
ncbi:MAG: IS66 family transposase [Leptospiraceae bacterium]|nr:IS66 family transposase [Leptospiraceae bacterium]